MENFVFVNVVQPHANLDEEHPNFSFLQVLFILLLQVV